MGAQRIHAASGTVEMVQAWFEECRDARNPAGIIITRIEDGEKPPGWERRQADVDEKKQRLEAEKLGAIEFKAIPAGEVPGLVDAAEKRMAANPKTRHIGKLDIAGRGGPDPVPDEAWGYRVERDEFWRGQVLLEFKAKMARGG